MRKAKSIELHARRRSSERFGLTVGKKRYAEMNAICSSGNYVCFLERQSCTKSKAIIMYDGEYIPVIYDKKRKQIITVLTLDMLSEKEMATLKEAIEQNGMEQIK